MDHFSVLIPQPHEQLVYSYTIYCTSEIYGAVCG